jgi:hypothetical protein
MLDVDFALRSDRTMKALTGLSRSEFQHLCPVFGQALMEHMQSRRSDRQRQPGGGGKYRLGPVEAKLFFILMYVKCYPTFDVASVLYQVHRSRPHRWVQTWLPVLEQALGYEVVLPERRIDQVESFFTRFPLVKDLFLDGTERPIRRPQDTGRQKRHTHNNLLLTDADRRVLALSPTQPGARHVYALLKAWDFPPRLPPDVVCWTDLGFQGMKTDSPHLSIIQPKKKPKGRKLDAVDRFINTQKSRIRIRVEHAIGGVKRLAAVAQPYRNHTPKMEDQLMLVACGLWNFHLKCTN